MSAKSKRNPSSCVSAHKRQSAVFAERIAGLDNASPQPKTADEVGADHLPGLAIANRCLGDGRE